jgi:hypothetical protein
MGASGLVLPCVALVNINVHWAHQATLDADVGGRFLVEEGRSLNAGGTLAEAVDVSLPAGLKAEIPSVDWRTASHYNLACGFCYGPMQSRDPVDGSTPEAQRGMRGEKADFDEVMEAAWLVAKEPGVSLKLATVVSSVNRDNLPALSRTAGDLALDVWRLYQYSSRGDGTPASCGTRWQTTSSSAWPRRSRACPHRYRRCRPAKPRRRTASSWIRPVMFSSRSAPGTSGTGTAWKNRWIASGPKSRRGQRLSPTNAGFLSSATRWCRRTGVFQRRTQLLTGGARDGYEPEEGCMVRRMGRIGPATWRWSGLHMDDGTDARVQVPSMASLDAHRGDSYRSVYVLRVPGRMRWPAHAPVQSAAPPPWAGFGGASPPVRECGWPRANV